MTNSTERQMELENILEGFDLRMMTDEDFDLMRAAIEEMESILIARNIRAYSPKNGKWTLNIKTRDNCHGL